MLPKNYLKTGLACAVLGSLVVPAAAAPAVMLEAVSFQAGPSRTDDSLGKLATGDRVEVIWCATKDGQCLVEIHNRKGWVPLALLNLKPGRKKSAADEFGGAGSSSGSGSGNTASGPADTPGGRPADPAKAEIKQNISNNERPSGSSIPFSKF